MISTALLVGSSLFGAFGSFGSSSAARREGKRQAQAEKEKTAEEVRRTARENTQIQSMTRAIMGASGTTGAGSQTVYLKDMQAEQQRELQWIRKVGASNADALRRQGNALASQYKMQGLTSLFQAGATAFGTEGK